MAKVKVVVNRPALRQILRGEVGNVRRVLEDKGQRVVAAAGPGHEAQTFVGRNRVRVTVRTATFAARHEEATNRTLTRAIDAARG